MSLSPLQKGEGDRRTLVLCYFVGPPATSFLAALGPGPCVLADLDDAAGRFARPPGAGGVDPVASAVAMARQLGFEPGPVVLIGWSAGCQAVREQLRASAGEVGAVVALDGISGAVPPTDAQLAPWLSLATLAAENDRTLLVVTHTQQTYTEDLPVGQRFASTSRTAALICDRVGLVAPAPGDTSSIGGLVVVSSPSGRVDGQAHMRQVREVLPAVARDHLVPWLAKGPGALPSGDLP